MSARLRGMVMIFHELNVFDMYMYMMQSLQNAVVEAASKANAASFSETLSDKYETIVGELGGKLSGGQVPSVHRHTLNYVNQLLTCKYSF